MWDIIDIMICWCGVQLKRYFSSTRFTLKDYLNCLLMGHAMLSWYDVGRIFVDVVGCCFLALEDVL